jgi:hypothetical protein
VWVCLLWPAFVCVWPGLLCVLLSVEPRLLRLLAPMLLVVSLVPLCNNILTPAALPLGFLANEAVQAGGPCRCWAAFITLALRELSNPLYRCDQSICRSGSYPATGASVGPTGCPAHCRGCAVLPWVVVCSLSTFVLVLVRCWACIAFSGWVSGLLRLPSLVPGSGFVQSVVLPGLSVWGAPIVL